MHYVFKIVAFFATGLILMTGRAEEKMSGYGLSQFGDFESSWRQVTVRYRVDTSEMRFTFANPAAWKVLDAGGTDYPDGAIFAKIGLVSESDPAFESSKVPSGTRRYQFMVRDRKKHASTGGWGYAIFYENDRPKESEATVTNACYACHRVVAHRGDVFSQKLTFRKKETFPGWKKGADQKLSETSVSGGVPFLDANMSEQPLALRKFVPTSVKKLRLVGGEIPKHVFSGTLDEIRPALAKESLRSGLPAALVSHDGKDFSVVYQHTTARGTCQDLGGGTGVLMKGLHTVWLDASGKRSLVKVEFCLPGNNASD